MAPPEPRACALSVVVTTYTRRRLKTLLEGLDALLRQPVPDLEVVFVGERDPSLCEEVSAFAREWGEAERVRVLFHQGPPGLASARNLGAEHARGEVIAFLDDDALPFPDWAEQVCRAFADYPQAIGLTGPVFPLWENGNPTWFPDELAWVVSGTAWTGLERVEEVRNAWGVNMAFRREAFAVCRFDDSTFGRTPGLHEEGKRGPVGDETEFCLRLRQATGRPILFNPAVRVYHRVEAWRLSPRFLRRQAFWQGYTRAMLARYYKGSWRGPGPLLGPEYRLLARILFRLLPHSLALLPLRPGWSLRRLAVTGWVVGFVGLGYLGGLAPSVGRRLGRWV